MSIVERLRFYAEHTDLALELQGSPSSCDDELQPVLVEALSTIERMTNELSELQAYLSTCVSNETFLDQDARRVAQIEKLEKRLAAAETIIEPLAEVARKEDDRSGLEFDDEWPEWKPLRPDGEYVSVYSHDIVMRHFRAARTWMEDKS